MENYLDRAKKYIKKNEGLRLQVYNCSAGHPTIGYGHKLLPNEKTIKNITRDIASRLFKRDFTSALHEAVKLDAFHRVNDHGKIVLLDMCYNMGGQRLGMFKKMLAALERKDYTIAAQELMDSRYAKQVGARAAKNYVILTSEYQPYA